MGGRHTKFILKFLVIFSEAIYTSSVCAAQLNHEKLNNDLDYLRVSSHQLQDPAINYHSIEPQDDRRQQSRTIEQLTNHIGKPLVALPSKPGNFQIRSNSSSASQSKKTRYYDATGQSRVADQNGRLMVSQRRIASSGVCQWMSLQEFKNVSLATGELIIRDSEGEPRYILTIRGSLRRDDDSYFPLNKFQVHQEASTVVIGSSSGGASVNLPGNCTANFKNRSDGATMLLPIQRPGRLFEEKITLVVECGYLVLQLQGNGIYLILKSISFYRDLDAVSQTHYSFKKNRSQSRAKPAMQAEHLVFSNEGTQVYPLLVLPLTSRYICQNRIVLTGKNLVQLELNRFELQRLTYPMLEEFKWYPDNADDNQAKVITLPGRPTELRIKRDTDGLVQRDSPSSGAKCPKPTGPLEPLTFMMDPLSVKRNYDSLNEALSDKLTQIRSSASHWRDLTVVDLKARLTTTIMIYLLILYMVSYLVCGFKNI